MDHCDHKSSTMLRQLQSPDCDHSRRNDAVKNTVNRFILGQPDDEKTTET